MLKDAAINAKPTKNTQNIRHGMYDGTAVSKDCDAERCSAPKTANGMAKHKWVRATTLSTPRDRAISFLVANIPNPKSARPAADMDKTVPENVGNMARIGSCIDL